MPATRLHQIIAVTRGVSADTEGKLAQVRQVLGYKDDSSPLTGLSRTYESAEVDGPELDPTDRRVQVTVPELAGVVTGALTRLFDVQYTREEANTRAKADVVLDDGTVLLSAVPATYLLFLESQLQELITKMIEQLPVLDQRENWDDAGADPSLRPGIRVTKPVRKVHPGRRPQVQVLYDATPEHPAQVRPYETDVVVGYWTIRKYSGALPAAELQSVRDRAGRLLAAVRMAREAANQVEVSDQRAGETLLRWVFGPAMVGG